MLHNVKTICTRTVQNKISMVQPTLHQPPSAIYRKTLASAIDPSLNMMRPFGNKGGELETRAVVRGPTFDKLCVYISSHGGCNLGCKQCHLTQNKQTSMKPSTMQDYVQQCNDMFVQFPKLRSYSANKITRITAEFMARGEPLENRVVRNEWNQLYMALHKTFDEHRQLSFPQVTSDAFKCHISTLMPHSFRNKSLVETFMPYGSSPASWPVIYYSAWFLRPEIQREWMPNALPVSVALDKLSEYQQEMHRRTGSSEMGQSKVLLHRAFLDGLNDSPQEMQDLVDLMKAKNVVARINSLRYSPPENEPNKQQETPDPRRSQCLMFLKINNPGGFKEIERAGEDVRASCGVFMPPLPRF